MSKNCWSSNRIADTDDHHEFKGKEDKRKSDLREHLNNRKSKPYQKNEASKSSKPRQSLQLETNPEILQRRQKQIDYGKNTVGYHKYIHQVPIHQRTKDDPETPDKYCKYSRRSWDTLIKIWRTNLHKYDENIEESNTVSTDED